MALFDEHIRETGRYVERMRAAGRPARELWNERGVAGPADEAGATAAPAGGTGAGAAFGAPAAPSPLPFKVGSGAGPGLVLKSETFLELGSPTAGSCAFALLTQETGLVHGGRITLIGPDIPECAAGATVAFGQVIIAGGAAITKAHYPQLLESQYVGDQIEGFMVKSAPGRVWGRMSAEAAQRGFDFAFLGAALMSIVRAQIPEATAVEVLFVTSGKVDLQPLAEIARAVGRIAHSLKDQRWKERGVDISDCAFGGLCGSCPDKPVCDEVKKLAHARDLMAAGANA
jgi:CO dehydrogenase/acetyl-CoA synthase beta subunit